MIDDYLRQRVVERVRHGIEEATGAAVTIDLPGPSLFRDLRRRLIPAATVTMMNVPIAEGRTTLDELVVNLTDLHLTGPRANPVVRIDRGIFRAVLSVDAVNTLVTLPPGLQRVEFTNTRARVRTTAGLAIDTTVDLTPRGIRITATGGLLSFLPTAGWTVPWPALPYGATVTDLTPQPRAVVFSGTLDPAMLVFSRDNAASDGSSA